MEESDKLKATLSLAAVINEWIQNNCDEYDVGYWYPDQDFDMAAAAVGVLIASAKGQQFFAKES
jgi:hypothetical protein